MSNVAAEYAIVGQTLTLIADTQYAALAGTSNCEICYQQKGRSVIALPAEVVEDAPTKLTATIDADAMDLKANIRAWTRARGAGTIIFIGQAAMIRVLDEGELA